MAYRLCGQNFLLSDHRHDTSWRNLTSSFSGFSLDRNTCSLYWGSLYDELRQASEILSGRG